MENTTKKWLKITAIILAVLIVAMAATLGGMAAAHYAKVSDVESLTVEYNGEKLNVILMIGDGMGFSHVSAATAKYGDLFFDTKADYKSSVTTFSRDVFDPTDSAAAATASRRDIRRITA